MRRGHEEYLHAQVFKQFPAERLLHQLSAAVAVGQLGMNLAQRHSAALGVSGVYTPGKHWWLALQMWMMQEQPCQLRTRISGHSNDRGLYRLIHDSSNVLIRASISLARFTSGQMINTVSSPATVPTTSGQPARSSDAATGCAPPITVRTTT